MITVLCVCVCVCACVCVCECVCAQVLFFSSFFVSEMYALIKDTEMLS